MLEEKDILSVVANAFQEAQTHQDLETPLNYYLGNPDGKEISGRSTVVSTDVADAVEWIMPQIMKSFTQNNEVVIFDPLGPEDELQAELESKYVYDVIMKENDGFIILHQFVKDALLHNNGLIKVYYEKKEKITVESFSGLSEAQVVACTQAPNVEVIQYDQDPLSGALNLQIKITTPNGGIRLESIPPEQVFVTSDHDSINLDKAKFVAHVTNKTYSDLIEEGYSQEILEDIGNNLRFGDSDFRFYAQNESVSRDTWDNTDVSMRLIEVSECYMFIDLNDDGVAEYCKITVAGKDNPTHILSLEELDYSPWVSTTAILMSHKFRGLSIYDRLRQIQDQKTALLRNMLDNIYLQNNQRSIVIEGQVNLDDLLVSRPGGIIRAKRTDAISPLVTPQLGQDAYNMMNYLDSVRAGRVGVEPEGGATPQKIGARVGSEGVERLLTAKEELVGLIVRVIAETGMKPLCNKIRDLCTKHVDAVQNFKFRGMWVQTNPAQWIERSRSTVRVGTGTGDHAKQLTALQGILQIHSQLSQMPGQTLTNQNKTYAALDDICKFSDLNGASKYFLDPNSPEGQQAAQQAAEAAQQQQQAEMQQNMAIIQAQVQLAQAELQKAEAQQNNVALKAQIDQLKTQLEAAKAAADAAAKDADRELKKHEIDTRAAIELTKIEAENQRQEEANAQQNKEALSGSNKQAA